MSEPLMSVAGQLVGIPAEKYSGTNGVTVDQNNKTIGLDETVLYNNASPEQILSNTSVPLSESYLHFKELRLYLLASAGSTYNANYVVSSQVLQNDGTEISAQPIANAQGTIMCDSNCYVFNINEPTTCYIKSNGVRLNIQSSGITTTASRGARLFKIVGINRIGGNA